MTEQITYIESTQYDPYWNLALEEYLLMHCKERECILYLWQNARTIVVGRNQNVWKECKAAELEKDGGHVVRRLSGGGAVYHDLGNLNFTFVARKEEYDLDRQLEVILRAVQKLGVPAERSGRNDILADGGKISGNAYYETDGRCYHHGTLMVDVDLNELTRYLTVSKEKLQSKGVDSVRSRVRNLSDYIPDLTVGSLKAALKKSFEDVYGHTARERNEADLNQEEIEALHRKFCSWEWIYGRKIDFQYEMAKRFPWGQVELQFQVEGGRIEEVQAYSDALRPEIIQALPTYLEHVRYNNHAICERLSLYRSSDQESEAMMEDIRRWLGTAEL